MIKLSTSYLTDLKREAATAESCRDQAIAFGTEEAYAMIADDWWRAFFLAIATDGYAAARQTAGRITIDARLALFGKWRAGYIGWDCDAEQDVIWTRQSSRRYFDWLKVFRKGLAAAAFLHDWRAAAEIAAYADDDIVPSKAVLDAELTPDAVLFYVYLGRLICGKPSGITSSTPYKAKAPHPRAKLLRECVLTLSAKDACGFESALMSYLKFYSTRERDKETPIELISIDGTILFHYGHHHLDVAAQLPPELASFVARDLGAGISSKKVPDAAASPAVKRSTAPSRQKRS